MTAKEFWKQKFDEYPQNDAEKLAVVMMQEYSQYILTDKDKEIERLKGLLKDVVFDYAVEFVWTDELVKEMIYLKLPIPEHYAGNLQKCLDEFKNSDHHKDYNYE